MAEIKILIEGVHKFVSDIKAEISCTTTLIKSDKNIIVDPGAFINRDKLIDALRREKLRSEDIDAIVLTHLHLDHIANIFLFPKAKIFLRFISGKYPGQFQKIDEGYLQRFDLLNEQIAKNVKIIETPGHTIDQISLVIKTKEGNVVITGDAIPSKEWTDQNKKPVPDFVYSVDKFIESRRNILSIADYIIPGHGKMFKVEK